MPQWSPIITLLDITLLDNYLARQGLPTPTIEASFRLTRLHPIAPFSSLLPLLVLRNTNKQENPTRAIHVPTDLTLEASKAPTTHDSSPKRIITSPRANSYCHLLLTITANNHSCHAALAYSTAVHLLPPRPCLSLRLSLNWLWERIDI